MARATSSTAALALGLLFMALAGQCFASLQVGFYNGKCGTVDAEAVIFDVVKKHFMEDVDTVADLVRLQFHDCFVRGCDASILLDGRTSEKTATPNGSVDGYDIIEEAKVAVDQSCPGVVSCADIIAIAARAAVFLGGANWYEVETGRKDGRISRANEAEKSLPGPSIPIPLAISLFAQKGLNKEDFVVLLGCHTVGTAHCGNFQDRLYNFHGTNSSDPSMNPSLLSTLTETCPRNTIANNETNLDQTPGSEFVMDNAFYNAILEGKGVLEVDQQMAIDSNTKSLVQMLASDPKLFAAKIGPSMVKMGRIGVILNGEVRKGTCKVSNRG